MFFEEITSPKIFIDSDSNPYSKTNPKPNPNPNLHPKNKWKKRRWIFLIFVLFSLIKKFSLK